MRSWGNSSEKALNALGNYVKRKKILKYFIFRIQLQLKILISWKGLQRLNQIKTGLCWRFFRIFSICSKNRKLQCLSPCQSIQAPPQYIRARWESRFWLQMVGWFLSGQFSGNLAKYNEHYLTCAKTDHYFTTLWQFKGHY